MSYFIAGHHHSLFGRTELADAIEHALPSRIRDDTLELNREVSFLRVYGTNKAIRDVIIKDDRTGSWLGVLGTPLMGRMREEEKDVLLKHFFKKPDDVITGDFDGSFAVLAYNGAEDLFFAATDLNNSIPIFFAETPDGIFFSSHELALARAFRGEIDPLGFAMTIQLKLAWGSLTRFKNIRKLLPAQLMVFQGARNIRHKIYWSPSGERQWPMDFDRALAAWLGILDSSVRSYVDASMNKHFICDITAGEDSRLLLSQCHALNISFHAMVDGTEEDIDVQISREAAKMAGFELVVRPSQSISADQLIVHASDISLENEANEDFFSSCTAFATELAFPAPNFEHVKFCGAPGGEVYRGSYYLRGKAIFPSSLGRFDHRFFVRMKFLLDFYPGLFRLPDVEFLEAVIASAEEALRPVSEFPLGIRIDHLLRYFQTCNTGLIYKNPRYLPLATNSMTRAIYQIPPRFKRGGKLTKASTEVLYPRLAWVRTQKRVPTVRKTLLRSHLFFPEYYSTTKAVVSGTLKRLLKWTESNKPGFQWNRNAPTLSVLFRADPFREWFLSSRSMMTGHLYNNAVLDRLLSDAISGSTRQLPTLGRIINQEIACRWVYRDDGG